MAGSHLEDDKRILALSPAEREEREISADEVREALQNVLEQGSREDKVLVDCTLPDLDFAYRTIDSDERHPIVFRDCSIGQLDATHADVRLPVRFETCTIDGLVLTGATFESDLVVEEATVTGAVEAVETHFDRDAEFTGTTFTAPVTMNEASFGDDTSFTDVGFEAEASFRGAAFHGMSNELGDNAAFAGARFEAGGDFRQATFEFATFEDANFEGMAGYEEVRFDGDADFTGVSFHSDADFDEATFTEDASFAETVFDAPAVFRGAVFEGGTRTLQDDATFANAAFHASANFRSARFRYVTFEAATFDDRTMFEEAQFDEDADFVEAVFEGEADFDETRFDGDADFSSVRFEQPAVFRGAAFEGESQHHTQSAVFEAVRFTDAVDFDNATFTSANFSQARFGGVVDFAGAEFEELEFFVEPIDDAYVDFTDAVLKEGHISQPDGAWVRYDLTQASIGDVELMTERSGGRHELLDYFRFCNTEFNEFDGYEFDFSAHTYYLDRNGWNLHSFDDYVTDREYAAPMTPENIETTYLKAKNAASNGGYVKAAGEFRVQRQRYARRKHLSIARDPETDLRGRLSSASRAAENYFLDVTCGYGMRLGRIFSVFLLVPLFPAFLYTFGGKPFLTGAGQLSSLGQLATPAGQAIFYKNLHFSYITFLTIGYGGIGPKGALARLLAGLEVYLSVILGGLVLYALIKRSEL